METQEILDCENVVCPFCDEVIHERDGEITEWDVCEHTVFLATNEGGFEYVRNDMKDLINNESARGSFDSYTDNLPIEGVRIVSYGPFPSLFCVYWGFEGKIQNQQQKMMEYISLEIGAGEPAFCPYSGINLMQDFDNTKVPDTLVLAISWEVPDSPIYIERSIEDRFLQVLEESDYEVKDAIEKSKEVFSDFEHIVVMHVNYTSAVCGPIYETVTFVLRPLKN